MCCFKTRFFILVSQILIIQNLGILGSFGSVDAQSMMGKVDDIDDKLPPSEAVTRNGWQMGYSESNLNKHSVHYRGLTQRQEITQQSETFVCSNAAQLEGLYNESTKQWIIDDDTVSILDSDIQAIINCSSENDAILFRTQNTIKPRATITIPWTLTISGFFEGSSNNRESIAEARDKVRFTCPEKRPLIVARAPAFVFANMVIVRCNSSSDIVHMDSKCASSPRRNDQSHFIHMSFLRNRLFNNASILNAANASCTQLMLDNVKINHNNCSGKECVSLPSDTILQNVELYRNTNSTDSSVALCSVFLAGDDSQIIASKLSASKNRIRILNINNSTMTIRDSYFGENLNVNSSLSTNQFIQGGVLFSHQSQVSIYDTTFNSSFASTGGALYVHFTQLNISNCTFRQNNASANRGGAIQCVHGCSFNIRSTMFIANVARNGGAIYAERSNISLSDCQFINNSAADNGACGFRMLSTIKIEESEFDGNRAEKQHVGAIMIAWDSVAEINRSVFKNNRAEDLAGAIGVSVISQMRLYDVTLFNNSAIHDGGAIYVHTFSNATLLHSNFTKNRARSGGVLYARNSSTIFVSSSKFSQNEAYQDGGVFYVLSKSEITISNTLLEKNVGYSGGGVYASEICSLLISTCKFQKNKASYKGGGISLHDRITLLVSNSSMTRNRAQQGGALYTESQSKLTLLDSRFAENIATSNGGCLNIVDDSRATIANCSFRDSKAQVTGGAINADSSNLTVQSTEVYSNEGNEKCGGIRIFGSSSFLNASDLNLISNSANGSGGGICIADGSSFLCYSCSFKNNTASKGAGMYGSSRNRHQPIRAQLQDCAFVRNLATFAGGGLVFDSIHNRTDKCLQQGVFCDHIVLLNTSFVGNLATSSGPVILTTDPSSVLVSCDFDRGIQNDFIEKFNLLSLLPIHPNSLCISWKRNQVLSLESNNVIWTYGRRFNFSTDDLEKARITQEDSIFWLRNVQSGKRFPKIQISLVDRFGNAPAPTIPHVIRVSVESPERFFEGTVNVNITGGIGTIPEVVGFVKPGKYSLKIFPQNITSIEETILRIQVRDCVVGEAPTQDRVLCQECGENSYNFDPKNENGCTTCPETASCEGHYIVPKDGYWHKGPCNFQVKRCVLEDACTYDKRKQNLTDFSRNFIDCSFNNATLIAYGQMQCSKGYEGTLCGSCAQSYGLSLGQKCSECPTAAGSIITMIVLLLYLLVLCSFTIRGALPYQAKHTTSARQSRREILVWNTTRSVAINIQMVEMMRDGYVPPDAMRPSTNTHRTSSNSQQRHKGEMTGWKTAEIFKIMINFLQVTAAVGGIALNWSDGITVMFEATEYVGAITTVALSRPIDCILSSDSALVRSVWRTLINLLVPGIVIIIYIAYWGYIKVHKSKAWAFLWKRALLSIIVVIYISYLGLTKLAVRVFHCVKVFDSENHLASSWTWYWAVDTAIKCYGKEHSALISVGVIVLALVTLCFPFISASVITSYKDQRQNPESWINETMGFLYRAFKDRFMYWESIVMVRKAFLSVIIVFSYPLGGQLQASLALLLLMLSLCLQTVCTPYREEFSALNRYESASLFISSVTLILGQFLDSDRCSSNVKLSIVFFIVCLNVTTFLVLLITYLASGVDHMKATLEEEGIQIPDDVQWWGVIKIVCVTKLSQLKV